jgi:hypothetical protein
LIKNRIPNGEKNKNEEGEGQSKDEESEFVQVNKKSNEDGFDAGVSRLESRKNFSVKKGVGQKITKVMDRIKFVLDINKETWLDLSKVIKVTTLTGKSNAENLLKTISCLEEINKIKLARLLISMAEDDLGYVFIKDNLSELRGYIFKYEINNIF